MANTYKNFVATTTTSSVTVYECPAGKTAIVMLLRATNKTTSSTTVTITMTDVSGSKTIALVDGLGVPAKSAVRILEDRLILEAGDTIAISSATASAFDVAGSVTEI